MTSHHLETHHMKEPLTLGHLLPYETSIATVTLPKASLYSKVKSIKSAGFNSFELMEDDLSEIINDLPRFKSYLDEIGLKISIFQPFRDLEGSWSGFDGRLENFNKKLQMMNELGIDLILVCSNCLQPKFDIPREVFVKQLQISSDLALSKGIKIAYEALSWGTYTKKLEQNWEMVKLVDRQNFGICIDSFHIFVHGSSIDIVDEMIGKIFFVQLSDSVALRLPKIIDHSRNYRYLPGQGSFDIAGLVKKINDVGYEGPLSLECFCGPFKSFNNLNYVSREALDSLYNVQLDLLRAPSDENSYVSRIFGSDTGEVEGFITANKVINFKDPSHQMNVDILVHPQEIFETRYQLLHYDYLFTNSFTENPSGDQIQQNITLICSRLTFNSLQIYIKNVLGLKEELSKATYFGIPDYKRFGNGIVMINLECDDNQLPLKSCF